MEPRSSAVVIPMRPTVSARPRRVNSVFSVARPGGPRLYNKIELVERNGVRMARVIRRGLLIVHVLIDLAYLRRG